MVEIKYLSTKDVQTCLNLNKSLDENLMFDCAYLIASSFNFTKEKKMGKDQAPFEGSRKVIKSVGGGGEERESREPLEGGLRRDGQ